MINVILTLEFTEPQYNRLTREIHLLRQERLTRNFPLTETVNFFHRIRTHEGTLTAMFTRTGAQVLFDELFKFSTAMDRNKVSFELLLNLRGSLYRVLNNLPVNDEKGKLIT